jgi:peptide/nickel transport system substrate-binding protein
MTTDDSRVTITRRRFLQGCAMAGVTAATLPLSQVVWAAKGKVLRVRSYADLDALDPGFYQNAYNVDVMNCIYSKLVSYVPGHKWKWQLQAAESIKQVDPTHIRFKLRPGIAFTGGFGEMTADDVKYSFERVIKLNSPVKGDWGPLDHVEVEGRYGGVIVLKEPFAPLWNITLPYGAGCIVSKKAVEAAGGGNFGMKPPCFSGPYILNKWEPKQFTVLTRNPKWKGPKPGFDEIRIIPMDDEKTAEVGYEAGDLDFTNIALSDYGHYQKKKPADTTLVKYPSLYYVWLGMNQDNPKLKDINVRRAVQWAVNVPQLLDAAYFGQADPATGLIAPGLVGHRDKSLIPPAGNLDKARQYLRKAGVKNLSLRLDVLNASKWTTMGQVIQANLAQAGIKVELNLQDSGSFWTLGMEKKGDRWKKVQLVLNRFSMAPDPYYATEWFTCEQVGKWNWERFCNKEFDRLNAEATRETDPSKRAQMYYKMQDLMEQSGCYRFITHEANPIMYRTSLMEPGLRPDGRPLFRYFKAGA